MRRVERNGEKNVRDKSGEIDWLRIQPGDMGSSTRRYLYAPLLFLALQFNQNDDKS